MAQPSLSHLLAQYPGIHLTGEHVNQLPGENLDFLRRYLDAVKAAGGSQVDVISAYRSPAYNAGVGGAQYSNHTRGVAIDSRVYVPGKGWVMGGDLSTLAGQGLRSGDQAGFFHGQPDPEHVDAGYMAGTTAAAAPTASPPTVGGAPLTQPTIRPPAAASALAAPAAAPVAPPRVPLAAALNRPVTTDPRPPFLQALLGAITPTGQINPQQLMAALARRT